VLDSGRAGSSFGAWGSSVGAEGGCKPEESISLMLLALLASAVAWKSTASRKISVGSINDAGTMADNATSSRFTS
jgi:hypothetical protein